MEYPFIATVLHIPQSDGEAGVSPSEYLIFYPGLSLRGCFTLQQKCSWRVLQPQPTGLMVWKVKAQFDQQYNDQTV